MKREAIQKANRGTSYSISEAIWKNDQEVLKKLTGLK